MKKGKRERERERERGELLDNKKPFISLYIFKHVLKNNSDLFISIQ